jgi:hypothetical protein
MTITATLDKPAGYNAGDTMTLTVVSDKRLQTDTIDVASAGEDATVTTTVRAGFTYTDTLGKKWTVKSDDGKTLVLTATA